MHLAKEILDILICPETKQKVEIISPEMLSEINTKISQKALKRIDGSTVEEPLSEALITSDKSRIYPISNGIPNLVKEESIIL